MKNTLTATTDGRNGRALVRDLSVHFTLGRDTEKILQRRILKPTPGVQYRLIVVPGRRFSHKRRMTSKILQYATVRRLRRPPIIVGPLLRKFLSDDKIRKMGFLRLVIMHKPVNPPGARGPWSSQQLLTIVTFNGGNWLDLQSGLHRRHWCLEDGFVFLEPVEVKKK